MTSQRRVFVALSALLLISLVGCGRSPGIIDTGPRIATPTLPDVEGTLTGPLTDVSPMAQSGPSDPPLLGSVLVGRRGSNSPTPMAFDITDNTLLYSEYAGLGDSELSEISFSELSPGRVARVGYSGPVRESYPAQAIADYVVLVDPGS